jgi:hypothetical protein
VLLLCCRIASARCTLAAAPPHSYGSPAVGWRISALPWNPNRLEQRFGRIHRIGQKEVCHLWNLLAKDTREGDAYIQLLKKLEAAREALGDKVCDVLGQLFSDRSLRELLMDAVRYNERPDVKAQLELEIDGAVDQRHLEELLAQRALVRQQQASRYPQRTATRSRSPSTR